MNIHITNWLTMQEIVTRPVTAISLHFNISLGEIRYKILIFQWVKLDIKLFRYTSHV